MMKDPQIESLIVETKELKRKIEGVKKQQAEAVAKGDMNLMRSIFFQHIELTTRLSEAEKELVIREKDQVISQVISEKDQVISQVIREKDQVIQEIKRK